MKEFVIGLVMIVGLVVILIGIGYPIKSYGCSSRWEGTYETDYSLITGCRVNVNGKWFPERNVREF